MLAVFVKAIVIKINCMYLKFSITLVQFKGTIAIGALSKRNP